MDSESVCIDAYHRGISRLSLYDGDDVKKLEFLFRAIEEQRKFLNDTIKSRDNHIHISSLIPIAIIPIGFFTSKGTLMSLEVSVCIILSCFLFLHSRYVFYREAYRVSRSGMYIASLEAQVLRISGIELWEMFSGSPNENISSLYADSTKGIRELFDFLPIFGIITALSLLIYSMKEDYIQLLPAVVLIFTFISYVSFRALHEKRRNFYAAKKELNDSRAKLNLIATEGFRKEQFGNKFEVCR